MAKIAEVTFTSDDRVRNVIHNFNADGFDSLYPKYKGGRPKTFTLPERREIKKIAKSRPAEHGLPFSAWSLTKLADFLVAEGVVDDISHEGLRILLREEGVTFQRLKTWKTSRDPEYAAKKARVEHLYAIADGEVIPEEGEPEVVFCMDEFGPLNLMPHPGRQWAERGGRHKDPDREPRPRRRATYTRPHGVRHLFAAYDLAKDKLYGHIKPRKNRARFLEFCRYLRSLYPPQVRIAIVLNNFSRPRRQRHSSTRRSRRSPSRGPTGRGPGNHHHIQLRRQRRSHHRREVAETSYGWTRRRPSPPPPRRSDRPPPPPLRRPRPTVSPR